MSNRNTISAGWGTSAGVLLGGATQTLANSGSIQALSDVALRGDSGAFAGAIDLSNTGDMTGGVFASTSQIDFSNAGTWNLRNFADTNGDGARDTKAVAISDFGTGPGSVVNEATGLVRLAPVTGAAATEVPGYYLPTTGIGGRPLEFGFYDFSREGLLQAQLVNLESFDNAGVIDLRGPVVGNTLVITGNPAAGGSPGTGVYRSDGGELLLNTRLNEGIPLGGQTNSYSDADR